MKNIVFVLLLVIGVFTNAQSIIGEWETFDDKTGDKLSIVEIYKSNNKYFGKITKLYEDPSDLVCDKCEDENKNKPIIGLVVLQNLGIDDDEYNNGTILDPNNGETYKCYIELINDNKLKLRGYIGISLIGRTQYWQRKI
ncbi:MAG: DUF2147 domain-containing protein [Flavobacteriaceae bacterium]